MASSAVAAPSGAVDSTSRFWLFQVLRAVPAAIAAVVITFSVDHSAPLGLTVFGGFALLSGLLALVLVPRTLKDDRGARLNFLISGVVSILAGIAALAFAGAGSAAVPALFLTVIVWALLTGVLELYSGFRVRGRSPYARDWMTIGGATVLLAVAYLLVPPGLNQQFEGPDGVVRSLTASIVTVGIFGAYAAIVAVLLIIGGFSLKWGTDARPTASPTGTTESQS
ncbi:DUF308 domain-containing protein [Mycetocola zhadangensis]|uniref:DUF308 domain-containing protein n=1 Tax=Mycetocola zhadangensis TaxID=1164595 RepID=A0A3L7J1H2_9MICO|nr:DUF308 domain-containing protein [Mycetocola zhadangensis]RLQ84320.1 DUF308 domain-containing protein [Mycetocola zhadangensis]GGE94128.1 hypothetical protein GCM10011313_16340 [Mycetocola zhadangensis]